MRRAVAVVLLAVPLAGCGGPSEREELDRWGRAADAACAKAERAIAGRGAPAGLDELLDLGDEGADDVRAAERDVLALEVPERSARVVEPVRAAMRDVAEAAGTLAGDGTPTLAAYSEATDELEGDLERLERAARTAGLRTCGRPEVRATMLDAVRTVVFAEQLQHLAKAFAKEITGLTTGTDNSPGRTESALIDAALAISDAQNALDRLRPPASAVSGADAYAEALLDLREVVGRGRDEFLSGPPPSPATCARALGRVTRAGGRTADVAARVVNRLERRLSRPGAESGAAPS